MTFCEPVIAGREVIKNIYLHAWSQHTLSLHTGWGTVWGNRNDAYSFRGKLEQLFPLEIRCAYKDLREFWE